MSTGNDIDIWDKYILDDFGRFLRRSFRKGKNKRKARRHREALERARTDLAMGSYNTSHSPLASKRSFFVPKFSHNPLRSFIHG